MSVDDIPLRPTAMKCGGSPFESALGQRYDALIESYETGDAAALVSLFTEDAALIEPDKPPIRGRESIAASLRHWFERFRFFNGRWELWELEALGDTAWDISYFELDAKRLETGELFREQWKQLSVWKCETDGGWRLHRLMFNSHRPPDSQNRE